MELFNDLPRKLRRLRSKYLHDYSELDGILSPRLRSGVSEIHGTGGFATHDIQLNGRIPMELMNLSHLTWFDICNNRLYARDSNLITFLSNLQSWWKGCQANPVMPWLNLLLRE